MFCCPLRGTHTPDRYKKDKEEENVYRFFMVGMGSAGKSTVLKQLHKLCHERPHVYKVYDKDWNPINHQYMSHELERWTRIIRGNIIDAVILIEEHIQSSGLRPFSLVGSSVLLNTDRTTINWDDIDNDIVEALLEVSQDDIFLQTVQRRSDLSPTIADGTIFYLNSRKIMKVFSRSYIPSDDDIVHARSPTTGIQHYRFGIRHMRIHIHDIGGQRVERAKLISYMNHWVATDQTGYHNFILYVMSIGDFDVPHPEYPSQSLLDESVAMLQHLMDLPIVQNCGMMVFFNKEDIFREKFEECKDSLEKREKALRWIGEHLKERDRRRFRDGRCEYKTVKGAIRRKVKRALESDRQIKRVNGTYKKYTCAVDTRMMDYIFTIIQNEIINYIIDTGGM